ncbi:MAG: RNA polymerase sigma factor [Gemmatales bacterium]|nr:RNA polymerase sigma factor [Gemmatales bacterium]MDW7994402.1 RNA polymerase sigma factor [Gemmatales bacterium]
MASPGDQRWVEAIISQYYQGLYRYAYRLTGSATEAEDLTQETFVKALTHHEQLRDAERIRPWLYSILRHEYLQRCRAHQQRGRMVSLDDFHDLPDGVVEAPAHVDTELLQQGLLQLPEEFRTPLVLAYWEDFRYQDIAEIMGIPIGTVMSRLWRAKQWLKHWLLNAPEGDFVKNKEAEKQPASEGSRLSHPRKNLLQHRRSSHAV